MGGAAPARNIRIRRSFMHENVAARARVLTGIQAKTALIHRGLEELVARHSARMLAGLGGSAPGTRAIRRRRPRPAR
jgi:hypothetical protein